MQKHILPKNSKYFFEVLNTGAQSIFVQLDEIFGMKKNETPVSDNYSVNLLSNAVLSYIGKRNNGFDAGCSLIIHEFMHINYVIQKMPLLYESVISEVEPDTVIDMKQYASIKTMLQDEIAESGMVNPSEKIIELLYSEDRQKTNILLNELFHKNFNNPHIIVGVLHIISHFEYDRVSPAGPTMAIAAISHKDVEVKEYGVKCFENWRHKDGIRILEQIKVEERWLQNYVDLVINDLKALG